MSRIQFQEGVKILCKHRFHMILVIRHSIKVLPAVEMEVICARPNRDYCLKRLDSLPNKHLRSHAPDTGEWLRQSSPFNGWYHDGDRLFWVNVIPRSGKSVVAAPLVHDFSNTENLPVLVILFRYANLANKPLRR